MADQGVRYVVRLDDLNVVSGLRGMEGQAVRTEASIASLNASLRGISGALGIGFGLHAFINFGKDAVQGAADYETAVKRIKFASENLFEGQKNIEFIRSEVDKFKIPLQSATDSYGKFLAMLAGSGIAGDRIRSLHDDLLMIGKIKGLGDGQLDAAVMNLGKMLESGSLDARHFRPLEQQLSGIGAFVAKELGISVHRLAILRNKGKMTTIDPKVLLTAIEKQAASLEQFLPESLTTIQSQINELNTDWLEFKNNLVYDNIAELRSLFDTLKDGVAFLRDHEESIVNAGKGLFFIGKVWAAWKVSLFAFHGIQRLVSIGLGVQTTSIVSQAEAMTGLNTQIALLNTNLEILITNQRAVAATGAVMMGGMEAQAMMAANLPIAMGGVARGANRGAAALGASIMRGTMMVGIAFLAAEAIAQLGGNKDEEGNYKTHWWQTLFGVTENLSGTNLKKQWLNDIQQQILAYPKNPMYEKYHMLNTRAIDIFQKNPWLMQYANKRPDGIPDVSNKGLHDMLVAQGVRFPSEDAEHYDEKGRKYTLAEQMVNAVKAVFATKPKTGYQKGDEAGLTDKIIPPNDRVTGQRVIQYNISIKEINGIKQNTVNEGGQMNTEEVAEKMADIIESILNDSQIRAGN